MTTATEPKRTRKALIGISEALEIVPCGATKLRELIDQKEFTTKRDGVGRGFRILLRRDECEVYAEGLLPDLRKFRRQKGRAK